MPGLPLLTLTDVWLNTVSKFPNKTALVADGEYSSYRALETEIACLAGRLRAIGVAPGDRVAVTMPNCREFYLAYWAILRAGAILAPVNHRLGYSEMVAVFDNIAPKLVFAHREVWEAVKAAVPTSSCLIGVGIAGVEQFADAIAGSTPIAPTPVNTEDIAIIAHTSGTTGTPKGAMMRHADLLFNIKNTVIPFGWRHEDVTLLLAPLFHVVGLYSIVPSSVYLGATVVMAPRADPDEVMELIERERITNFLAVPTFHHLVAVLPDIGEHDLSCLRMIGYSGSPMPARTIERLSTLFPHARLHNFFGLTETISLTHITPSNAALTYRDSIGKVIPDVGMKLLREDGGECDENEIGHLHIHRENTIRGYWRCPELLPQSLTPDGQWFNTGDLARVDEDGFVYLEGRRKEMIIVAGENVFALEVERCILDLPGVREVAVVGVPATGVRTALGELIKAVIVPVADETVAVRDVKRHCMERLASYKVPHIVEFRDALPRNASGKVLKQHLKDDSDER
jgi:acyl-CoA synthetase (AMP-forming)/AMP-acid ligase II